MTDNGESGAAGRSERLAAASARPAWSLVLLLNGLVLGALAGYVAARREPPPDYRYRATEDAVEFFDRTTGRLVSFTRADGLWFVMTHDPRTGTVHYQPTRTEEDPDFLRAVERLGRRLPEQLRRDLDLERLEP